MQTLAPGAFPLLALLLSVFPAVGARPLVEVRIDFGVVHQVLQGFGTSSRVWKDPHLSGTRRTLVPRWAQDEILTLLYRDLDLTRVRPILDGGIEPVNDNSDGRLDCPWPSSPAASFYHCCSRGKS